jgi:hypothetical protein
MDTPPPRASTSGGGASACRPSGATTNGMSGVEGTDAWTPTPGTRPGVTGEPAARLPPARVADRSTTRGETRVDAWAPCVCTRLGEAGGLAAQLPIAGGAGRPKTGSPNSRGDEEEGRCSVQRPGKDAPLNNHGKTVLTASTISFPHGVDGFGLKGVTAIQGASDPSNRPKATDLPCDPELLP